MKKTIIIIGLVILIISEIGFISYFYLTKEMPKNDVQKEKEKIVEKNAGFYTGILTKINENKTIEVKLSNEKFPLAHDMKTFNISLAVPKTAITKGVADNKKTANISDLRLGQQVNVEFDTKTKNIININIEEK